MKSAIILAILGAAAALPAPQGPPPGMDVPTASASDAMLDPTPTDDMADATPSGISWDGPQPTGGADRPGHKTQSFDDGSWKSMTFDDGSWSKWASATGGKPHGPHPTGWGGKPPHASGWGGKPPHASGWGGKPPHASGTGHHGGIPTPMPDDEASMTIQPFEPEETMVRRALDIDYHLAPRRHGEDGQQKGDYESWHKTQTFDDGSWGKWASKTGGEGGGHGPRPTGTGPDAPEGSLESHRNGRPQPSGGSHQADPSGGLEEPTPTAGGPMKPTPSDEDPSEPTPSAEDPAEATPTPSEDAPTPTASDDASDPTPTASDDAAEPTPTPEETPEAEEKR